MLMSAKFSSICAACTKRIAKGDPIDYSRVTRKAVHVQCAKNTEGPDLAQMFDMAYEDQCRDMCGL